MLFCCCFARSDSDREKFQLNEEVLSVVKVMYENYRVEEGGKKTLLRRP